MKEKIGIWGFGIVGKSALQYYAAKGHTIEILDKREITTDEQELIGTKHAHVAHDLEKFLHDNDIILCSPGINTDAFSTYRHKFITELDLFAHAWLKPVIGITGTLGKTSITHLLTQILAHAGKKVIAGGNIGTAMLDLVNQQEHLEMAVLELSSFQLEHANSFKPDLAIWTNFYPNHLDRHGTLQNYFSAKLMLIKNQDPAQQALVPWSLKQEIRAQVGPERPLAFFSTAYPGLERPNPQDTLYSVHNGSIVKFTHNTEQLLYAVHELPHLSYQENWLILIATLDMLNVPLACLKDMQSLSIPEHRLAPIATINEVTFYNDSKSTLGQATLAAVEQFRGRRIHLFLGGISKGVDRTGLIEALTGKVQAVYCFGSEAHTLGTICQNKGIKSSISSNLEQAFETCINNIKSGDVVLFSPAGASYDEFKNYEHRGSMFKLLVHNYQKRM